MTLRTLEDLVTAGLVEPDQAAGLAGVAAQYAVALTPEVVSLIHPEDVNDPIARQFVPDARELNRLPEERDDPIGDDAHSPVEGVVHRYPDRVLLKLVQVCAVYCRFCFRRESVGPGAKAFSSEVGTGSREENASKEKDAQVLSPEALEAALDYIAGQPDIWEVILTGGDPFVLSPRRLRAVAARLAAIPHVKILRVHTRVPVVAPERVTDELIAALKHEGLTPYVVVHANHAREFGEAARAACARLVDAGIPLLSQSVLLRGVNDDAETLAALMRTLVENRIKPYYLHHGDLAPGTSHFRTSIQEGQALMRALHGRVSGLCQPHYVLDIPGGYGKTPISPAYIRETAEGHEVEDFRGEVHGYSERVSKEIL